MKDASLNPHLNGVWVGNKKLPWALVFPRPHQKEMK